MILPSHDLLLRPEGRVYSIIPLAYVSIDLFICNISTVAFHQVTPYVSRTSTEMRSKEALPDAEDVGYTYITPPKSLTNLQHPKTLYKHLTLNRACITSSLRTRKRYIHHVYRPPPTSNSDHLRHRLYQPAKRQIRPSPDGDICIPSTFQDMGNPCCQDCAR